MCVLLPVLQKLHCSARFAVEFALICEFGTYYEEVGKYPKAADLSSPGSQVLDRGYADFREFPF
jgi:hypothetical protein